VSAFRRLVGALGSPSSQMRQISCDASSSSRTVSSGRTTIPARSAARRAEAAACARMPRDRGGRSSCVGDTTGSFHAFRAAAWWRATTSAGELWLRGPTRRRVDRKNRRMADSRLLDNLRARELAMVDALGALVEAESPTADPVACVACADVADGLAAELLGVRGERHEVDGRVHLRWRFGGSTRIVLVGHLDTVWPLGTIARWPFAVRDGRATGPGVFDMKAGVVQLLFALSTLESLDGVAVLLTTDEETGSPTARPLIEETAAGAPAALVLEPSAGGALKTERKGVGLYRIEVRGRAAHTGLDPEKGANAVVELAHQTLVAASLARPDLGTTVNPT